MNEAIITRKDGGEEIVPVYSPDEFLDRMNVDRILERIVYSLKSSRATKAVTYINIPAAFDIETSRVEIPGLDESFTFMYVWHICLGRTVCAGRTWDELRYLLRELHDRLGLHKDRVLRLYVHNLAYEWQFAHTQFPTRRMFARDVRVPVEWQLADEYEGIEFRCSYVLTNDSLAAWAQSEPSVPWGKQVGELDYNVIRTASTPLTPREWGYIAADVLTLSACIDAMISREWRHTVATLPLTKTGFVRRDMRRKFSTSREWVRYYDRVQLTPQAFIMYNEGLRGGDTHAMIISSRLIWPDVWSYDITSSYPYQMLAHKFPASAPVVIDHPTLAEFNAVIEDGRLWIARVHLTDLTLIDCTHYATIPLSKTTSHDSRDIRIDNGRIIYCREVYMTIYSTDWEIMAENYTFGVVGIERVLYHSECELLPSCLRDYILDLYGAKTTLKGITDDDQHGAENQYRLAKENINSVYGATITNPLNNTIEFDEERREWIDNTLEVTDANAGKIADELDRVHNSKNHFLPYCIGGWVAAYGRQQLYHALRGLRELDAAVYWDTDSVYFNDVRGRAVFERLNGEIRMHLLTIYDEDRIAPKDKNGRRHMIGLWDDQFSGGSVKFVTFGAKKYFYTENGSGVNHLTVAGLNKRTGAEHLTRLAGGEIINDKPVGGDFVETAELGLKWPAEASGRLSAQYSDDPMTLNVNGEDCTEGSYVNLIPTTYTLDETSVYQLEVLEARAQYQHRRR